MRKETWEASGFEITHTTTQSQECRLARIAIGLRRRGVASTTDEIGNNCNFTNFLDTQVDSYSHATAIQFMH